MSNHESTSVMGLSVPTAPSDNYKKRKFAQEDRRSRKRSRQDERSLAKPSRPIFREESIPSDAVIVLKPSRIAAILSKKKTSISLNLSLPASVQRIWLCSQLVEQVIECVASIASRTSGNAATDGNNFRELGSRNEAKVKSKYFYTICGVSQLQPSLKYAQLREEGRTGDQLANVQLLTRDVTSDLLSWPRTHVYGDDPESIEIRHALQNGSAQVEAIEKVVDQERSSLNKYENSPFQSHTISLYLPLPPIAQLYPLTGLCAEHISPLLLNYYKPLKGVALAYSDPRLSMELPLSTKDVRGQNPQLPQDNDKARGKPLLAPVHSEYAVPSIWLTVDLILLRPNRQCFVTGWINLVTESHIGLICWNLFSASIPAYYLPSDWEWIESKAKETYSLTEKHCANVEKRTNKDTDVTEGYFLDSSGKRVEGWLTFRVENFDITSVEKYGEKGFISLEGSLLNQGEVRQPSTETTKTHVPQERSFVDLASHEENGTDGR